MTGRRWTSKAQLSQEDWDAWGRGTIEILRVEWINQIISEPVGQCEWKQLPVIQTATLST